MFSLRQLEGFLKLAFLFINFILLSLKLTLNFKIRIICLSLPSSSYKSIKFLFFLLSALKQRGLCTILLSTIIFAITSASNTILNFMEVEMVRKLYHISELLVALLTGKSFITKIVVIN